MPGTPDNPLRVAIIGSGPAGFYATEQLLRQDDVATEVDLYDRLPTPFGLVRAGVAPDHPKLKSVIRVYEKTAARDGFRFFGNVNVGEHVSAAELGERYHAVIWSYGAESDRHLGIPGEDLPGSHPATAFVGWYNAHPDYADFEFDLSHERAVVIGNGNVAMDVTRMLALGVDELRTTDVADHAIGVLEAAGVREILVLGRRGPAQAAFTNPEILELGKMRDADCIVEQSDVELDSLSQAYLESDDADITARKNVDILREFAGRRPEGKPKRIVLRFLRSPIEIHGDGKVEAITIGTNELVDEDGAIRARDTGERETIECGIALRSVGYKGQGVDGLPFDERRGVLPNDGGRITDPETGEPVSGHYVAGWIKRGPSGVIGTNKKDAQDTVNSLIADVQAEALPEAAADPGAIADWLAERVPDHVTYAGWEAIDAAEQERGRPQDRPRVKFTRVDEMVEVARKGAPVVS
jgi:ferredoxin/flavodoxin---NADP+ reductase